MEKNLEDKVYADMYEDLRAAKVDPQEALTKVLEIFLTAEGIQ